MQNVCFKKILFIAQFPVDYQISIYNACRKNFNTNVVFLANYGHQNSYDPEFKSNIQRFNPHREWKFNYFFLNKKNFKNNGSFFAHSSLKHLTFIKDLKPDLVIMQGYFSFSEIMAIIYTKIFSEAKIILKGESVLNSELKKNKSFFLKLKILLKKIVLKYLLKCTDKIIFFSRKNMAFWKFYSVPDSKLFWAPCIADAQTYIFNKVEEDNKIIKLQKLFNSVPPKKVKLAFVGRFIERKRILETVKIITQNKNIQLFLAGSGILEQEIRELIIEKKINNVTLIGTLNYSELSVLYSQVDVGVLLSKYDPSPKVLNEFLDHEIPCIVSKEIGTANDLIKNNVSGYVLNEITTNSFNSVFKKLQKKKFFKNSLSFSKHIKKWSGEVWVKSFEKAVRKW
ncbi:MAG: hypothetical protein CBB97_07585 [Candidatus Endolissoclinum sp. TMED37]|nr:MAG: hypothetical protein CBB97_07585 [Candidatus Endolissoclinum sp. TMED37]|tara:strand:+ start:8087 stop:9277 length:1191 start_codon:yes stop_codon:yes gene_type:complete